MSILPKKKLEAVRSTRRVAIVLRDQDAVGVVYAEIKGQLPARDRLLEAIKSIENGEIYSDQDCTQLIDEEYIEVFRRKGAKIIDRDFVFLIERKYAEDHIVSVKLV
ncbi:hypothetical protein [Paenibacillus hexagrammi]|uniref:Uncharacterized protein n=1 Tax=Paenibacillus hexagrammi TaxID=2908839 RepID=A0ABY3SH97_9BACL|nr:hypothetical protein [Paenibacillus sp. YPD9-1]UJF32878.1 hypothetical protein L0M14_25415 [Paenibacillus sp. YPD9-1]